MSNFVMSIKITDSIADISQEILVCRQSHHGGTTSLKELCGIKLIYIGEVPDFFKG